MRKKGLFFFFLIVICLHSGVAEISSLSQIFLLGKGIKDLDGDKLGERISLHIIIPDTPKACELVVAGDIAARVNLESLAVDFSLIKRESEVKNIQDLENPILIGENLKWIKTLKKEGKLNLSQLKPNQGIVFLSSYKNQKVIVLLAGSEDALLRAGRSFFLRWPYLWEIWGREEGVTYFTVERDLAQFLKEQGLEPQNITIRSAFYEFPPTQSPHPVMKRLKFNQGEITNLAVEIDFAEKKQKEKALNAFDSLCLQHRKGQSTNILTYPGCASITLELQQGNNSSQITFPRMGYPKRILTPSYKRPFRSRISGKNFNLLNLFSSKGFYSDADKDGIMDTLDASLIIPQNSSLFGAAQLASRLVLKTAGASFPILYLEDYREGNSQITDVSSDLEKFFKGENGSAEAYFDRKLKKIINDIKGRNLEYIKAELFLPIKNQKFEEYIKKFLRDSAVAENLEIESFELRGSKEIFKKEKEFPWEGDETLKLIQEKIKTFNSSKLPVKISLGISESPDIRRKIKNKIKKILIQHNISKFEVKVLSAYKQGFFWLLEDILPALKGKNIGRLSIRFAEERDNFDKLKRFYSEPYRWLQELYPVDEILAKEANLPLDRIEFEMKKEKEPIYQVQAFDEKNRLLFEQGFSPRTRETTFLEVLPEWGTVKLTTGWLKIEKGNELVLDTSLKTDLEQFWSYYQKEILPSVYTYVMKKTGKDPTFSKQPYFKRLLVEMWFSEPDYKLGIDEEIVSSLEAIHDEIYFDTLDFLRGITEIDTEEREIPEDTFRYSAPGNILPLIHPSLEGGKGKVRIIFEDWQARSPQLILKWKEKTGEESSKKIVFPSIKAKDLHVPSFIYNGQKERIENLFIEVKVEKEAEYLTLIDLSESWRELQHKGIIKAFDYPKLKTITLRIKFKELEKEEPLLVSFKAPKEKSVPPPLPKNKNIVPTDRIISPQMCLDIVSQLSRFKTIHSYFGGRSYENRKIPVLEIFSPMEKYVSLPRLITFKPTLYLSARQHANEVSSTNYVLKLAELLAKERTYQKYAKKMNFVLHPMENPDGAELAYELQKLTPFHSLHAGRYSSLGIDVGSQVSTPKPLLPESKVRRNLYNKWLPDIYLNLHGYPSHEWVQQFSNYSPYLFRDYWIPRGMFTYYRSLSLPIYQKWKRSGDELRKFITQEIKANERIHSSNKIFYDRYYRWASRWQPHMDYLELHDGVLLYAKRRSSQASKLSTRRKITFVEETPELMDETAHGSWLNFLCEQGLTYLKAHMKYLSQVKFDIVRIEEEKRDRIHIRFSRSRPGEIKKSIKN